MELTTHVVPNSKAILLMICASSSKKPAPRKKKCHRNDRNVVPVSRTSIQQSISSTAEITITSNGRPQRPLIKVRPIVGSLRGRLHRHMNVLLYVRGKR